MFVVLTVSLVFFTGFHFNSNLGNIPAKLPSHRCLYLPIYLLVSFFLSFFFSFFFFLSFFLVDLVV